jgi:hypothetical protein
VFGLNTNIGVPSLYATLVCVACSQLEKLGAALLDIRQRRVTSEQDYGNESDGQGSELRTHNSEQIFLHMRKQLDECIRHHQEIKQYGYS